MDRELLYSVTRKDLKIEFFSGTGGGGQHRNKHQNCVRLYHPDSGTRTTGQSNKERKANLTEAFKNLTKSTSFKLWHISKLTELYTGKTVEQRVDEEMALENLRVEYKEKGGTWIPEPCKN